MLKTVSTANGLVSPTFSGDVTLSTGNLVIGTSGKGIDFSATPGTGTSELLSDYEEGTWTPGSGGGLAVAGTFSSEGTYIKIGKQVTVFGSVTGSTSVSTTAAGQMFTGLPFAKGSSPGTGVLFASSLTASGVLAISGTASFAMSAVSAPTLSFTVTYSV